MQKLIAKYGLAAHLAILAVAPLFLFPFFDDGVSAVVTLWLSLPAIVWVFMQPSVRRGEMLHDARQRVFSSVCKDSLFWVLVAAVAFCGLRALNSGVALVYDAESLKWIISAPAFPLLPASSGDAGFFPFAGSVACLVLVVGCRHALGRSARQAYFLLSSALAGTAAALALFMANLGNAAASDAMKCPYASLSFVGVAFAVHCMSGLVAVVSAVENKWNRVVPVLVLSAGFTAAGAFAFAPAYVSGIFLVAWVAVFGYAFFYAFYVLRSASEFKMLVLVSVSILSGWVLVSMTAPGSFIASRAAAFADRVFFADWYESARSAVTALSLKAWMASPWTGTGVGSFGLDIRFNATPADWAAIPRGMAASPLGWMLLITERGIAGAAMMALPLVLMTVTYVVRFVGWLFSRRAPRPGCWTAPAVVLAVVATGFFDCSYLRVDVLMAVSAVLALSPSAFPMKAAKGEKDG